MKSIHLIRHAKSSWKNPNLTDMDRPLNKRGIQSCAIMAPQLIKANCDFTQIFCSPAVRAQSTISLIAKAIPHAGIHWQVDAALYTFDLKQLLRWLHQLNEDLNAVTIIGHNPALTELVNYLGQTKIENLPTCAYAKLNAFNSETSWQSIKAATFHLDCLITPKNVISKD